MKDEPQITRVRGDDGPLFAWVTSGELYWVSFRSGEEGRYLYRNENRDLSVVSGDVAKTSSMFSAEIGDKQRAEWFIRKKLSHVMLSLFGPAHSYLVDEEYLRSREQLPASVWEGEGARDKNRESERILRSYLLPIEPRVNNERWELSFFVTQRKGSVEKWLLGGCVYPITVDHLEKIIVEEEGVVLPIPETE